MKQIKPPREELQPIDEEKEVAIKKKDKELLSFVEEEEEDNKVVLFFEEQIMAFDPLQEDGDLLLEKEEYNLLQQAILHDMEDGKEDPKDSSILEDGHANIHDVSPQPMHIIAAMMEEINDKNDLLDEFDAICSSIELESSSPIYEEHVLQ